MGEEVAALAGPAGRSGYVGTCVVTAGGAGGAGGGRVKCFGRNRHGNLGRVPEGLTPLGADLPFLDLGTGRTARVRPLYYHYDYHDYGYGPSTDAIARSID